ncbi:MAG: hypothetical protein ACREP9_07240, partial [Candidatus Dormibacteraceae bacterium]
TTAPAGDLIGYGFAVYRDDRGPYFSSLNLTDPAAILSSSTVFTGIPGGPTDLFQRTSFSPELAISNFSAKPAQVSVTLATTTAGKTKADKVQKFVLAGHSSRTVKLAARGDPGMTNSLVVQSSLPPGEVVSQFIAWGDSLVRAVELQGKDAASPQNGGGHPWDIRGGAKSTLFLFSHSSGEVKKIDVQISSGSELWWKTYKLSPMETKAVNINDIVAQGIPDDRGHRLPKDTLRGQIAWLAGFPKWAKGRLMISQGERGLARSFSCGTCTTDCDHPSMSPHSSVTLAVGSSDYLGDIQLQNCSISCPLSSDAEPR